MGLMNGPGGRTLRLSNLLFLNIEHGLYIVLGIVLSFTALMALVVAIITLFNGALNWETSDTLLVIIDRLLFVLMLAEILHTVRVSITSGTLNCEPFLIVGLIASIRRVLVITLASSHTAPDSMLAPDHQAIFQASMIELGVLAALILVMVISIYLLRRADTTASMLRERDIGLNRFGLNRFGLNRFGLNRFGLNRSVAQIGKPATPCTPTADRLAHLAPSHLDRNAAHTPHPIHSIRPVIPLAIFSEPQPHTSLFLICIKQYARTTYQRMSDPPPMPSLPIAFMDRLIDFLLPFFLGLAQDPEVARAEIVETLVSYGARTRSEFLNAAQIIAFSLSAIDTLSEAKATELSATMRLRFRGCASSLNRAGQQNEKTLAKRLTDDLPASDPLTCNQPTRGATAFEPGSDVTEAQACETLQQARANINTIRTGLSGVHPANSASTVSTAQQDRTKKLWGNAIMEVLAGMEQPSAPAVSGHRSTSMPPSR